MVQALVLLLLLMAAAPSLAQNTPTCTVAVQPTEAVGTANVTVTWNSNNAVLCVASGRWSGPKDCGGGSVVIQGVSETSEFKLAVKSATGKVTARWTKPTTNTDGSPATVTGFKLYIADSAAEVPDDAPDSFPATTLEHIFWRPPGNVNVGVKAVRADSVESVMSNIGGKNVVAASATCSATVTIKPRPKPPSLTISRLKEFLGLSDKNGDKT